MMKTLALVSAVILSCLSVFSTARAQLLSGFGVKAGLAVASQDFDYTEFASSMDRRTGFDVGAFVNVLRLGRMSLIAELHYVQKGMVEEQVITGEEGPEVIGTLNFDNRVDYLSVPVLAVLKLSSKPFHPYLLAGPRVDYLLSYTSDLSLYDPVYDDFEKVDLGGDVGIGAEYDMPGPVMFILEARYSHSFSDSYKSAGLRVRNRSFEVLVGAGF